MRSDRRRFRRLERCFNVTFAIGGDTGSQFLRDGVTRNISAGGMYFTTPDRAGLEAGRKLALRIYVPCAGRMTEHELVACVDGRVVRTADNRAGEPEEGLAVAVEFEHRPNLDFEMLAYRSPRSPRN